MIPPLDLKNARKETVAIYRLLSSAFSMTSRES